MTPTGPSLNFAHCRSSTPPTTKLTFHRRTNRLIQLSGAPISNKNLNNNKPSHSPSLAVVDAGVRARVCVCVGSYSCAGRLSGRRVQKPHFGPPPSIVGIACAHIHTDKASSCSQLAASQRVVYTQYTRCALTGAADSSCPHNRSGSSAQQHIFTLMLSPSAIIISVVVQPCSCVCVSE